MEYEIRKVKGELVPANIYWADTGEPLDNEDLELLHSLILSRLDEQWDEMRNAFFE